MALKDQNFEVWQGDHKTIQCTVRDVEALPYAQAKWIMAVNVGTAPLINKAGTIVDNVITINLLPADTDEIPEDLLHPKNNFYHELEVIDNYGNVSTVATGTVRVYPTSRFVEMTP